MRKPKSSPESKVKWSLIRSMNNPPFLTWVGSQVPNEQTDGAIIHFTADWKNPAPRDGALCHTGFQTDHRMWTRQPFQRLGIESHS